MVEKIRFVVSLFVSIIINLFGKNPHGKAGSILIFRLDHLGDMVYTLDAIQNVRREYPMSQICLVTGSWNMDLFINSPIIDSLIIYDSPMHARKREKAARFRDKIMLAKSLKRKNIDLIISFRDDFFTIFLSLYLFPIFRRDLGTVRVSTKLKKVIGGYSRKIEIPRHEKEINREVVLPLLDSYKGGGQVLRFTAEEEKWLTECLKANGIERKNYAILHPGAFWEFRRWDSLRFNEIGRYLFNRFGIRSVVIGSIDEFEVGSKACRDDHIAFLNLVGATTLRQTIILIANAAITICNDSGPMHLSSQLGILTICLLGPAAIERFGPRGSRVVYFHKPVECWPCKQDICKHPELPCVNLITSSEVMKTIERELIKDGYQ
jgi:heptosyltransferase-2